MLEGYVIVAVAVVAPAANSVALGLHAGASARRAALYDWVRAREAAAVGLLAMG